MFTTFQPSKLVKLQHFGFMLDHEKEN